MKVILNIFRDLLIRLLPKKLVKYFIEPRTFVWLVHPRDAADITKKISLLKFFPDNFVIGITKFFWPFIVSGFFSEQNKLKGYVIAVPLVPQQISSNQKLSIKKTIQALTFADKIGAKYISLGGFLPSIVYRNELNKKFNMEFFDGTNLLARLVVKKIEDISTEDKLNSKNITFGIIGATTKIGAILTKLLIQQNIRQIILFGKTLEHLINLKQECLEITRNVGIEISTDLSNLKKCNFVILTAYLVKDEEIIKYLKENTIFLSAIEPISPFVFELKKVRNDIKVIMGISIKTPGVSYRGYDFGLPKENSFACVTEAIILINDEYATKSVFANDTKKSLRAIEDLFNKYKFAKV